VCHIHTIKRIASIKQYVSLHIIKSLRLLASIYQWESKGDRFARSQLRRSTRASLVPPCDLWPAAHLVHLVVVDKRPRSSSPLWFVPSACTPVDTTPALCRSHTWFSCTLIYRKYVCKWEFRCQKVACIGALKLNKKYIKKESSYSSHLPVDHTSISGWTPEQVHP
jgi:hypothetical protein